MPRVSFEVSWNRPDDSQKRPSALVGEVAPLLRKLDDSAEWLETVEDPAVGLAACCEELRPRSLRSHHVLAWLLLQVAGLVSFLALLREIRQQLSLFDATLAEFCGPDRIAPGGFCIGADWKETLSQVLSFPPQTSDEFDVVVPLDLPLNSFETHSHPPTFLLAVEPLPPATDFGWKVELKPEGCFMATPHIAGTGSETRVVTQRFCGHDTKWSGKMSLTSRVSAEARVRVSVVDSQVDHLEEVHRQKQCSFEKSWQYFSTHKEGQHHSVLVFTQLAMQAFLAMSLAMVSILYYRVHTGAGGGALLRRLIVLKLVVQDFPQQVCMVCYLYGWYATNGLRCQMCIFHPLHCDQENPLHGTNLAACAVVALSASANQILVKAKGVDIDEDWCMVVTFRFCLLSASLVPFSTAVYLSPFCFSYENLRQTVCMLFAAGVPLVAGWGTLCCGWLFVVFRDELDAVDL